MTAAGSAHRTHGNPLRMFFSPAPWAATGYLATYIVTGTLLFSVALTVVLTAGVLSIVWVGLPLLVAAAVVVRGSANVERFRAALVTEPIPAAYREVVGSGLFAQLKTRWADPATLRDLVYLVLLYVPLLVLDTVVLAVWLAFVGMITVPLWFWSIPQDFDGGTTAHGVMIGYLEQPRNSFGGGEFGIWVGDLPTALGVAAVFFVLSLALSYVVTGAARLHAGIARALLAPYTDPLAPAKRTLDEAGPLSRSAVD
ncbi:hypothetical protein GCM10027271_16970 [Saccharopolyspora gloriosae]|uniref:Putative sensor domain-containing protein n=1 Tax=Saccharopolyspora gloriosae TaxID=455344 RepID=A0A840NG57_9PSEU|nr:sensor domain-containing protein [Saccharopolyspora gloriosae]MBB5067247.1 hypothetical protein [Saccharopolyspora gloriosae]